MSEKSRFLHLGHDGGGVRVPAEDPPTHTRLRGVGAPSPASILCVLETSAGSGPAAVLQRGVAAKLGRVGDEHGAHGGVPDRSRAEAEQEDGCCLEQAVVPEKRRGLVETGRLISFHFGAPRGYEEKLGRSLLKNWFAGMSFLNHSVAFTW